VGDLLAVGFDDLGAPPCEVRALSDFGDGSHGRLSRNVGSFVNAFIRQVFSTLLRISLLSGTGPTGPLGPRGGARVAV
jgi:hypothetical protein